KVLPAMVLSHSLGVSGFDFIVGYVTPLGCITSIHVFYSLHSFLAYFSFGVRADWLKLLKTRYEHVHVRLFRAVPGPQQF
ncbi:MAG: hypothetical protein SV598_04685, partial [Pseudomonadota bacterium]|nr:hypothetical protein [Pseudomonadota bacterium]